MSTYTFRHKRNIFVVEVALRKEDEHLGTSIIHASGVVQSRPATATNRASFISLAIADIPHF